MLAVADTGPLNYLALIGCVDMLGQLFDRVVVPGAVESELSSPNAPVAVRLWVGAPPPWFSVMTISADEQAEGTAALDSGEQEAIALALRLQADLTLLDDRAGVAAARARGLMVTGTLGLLVRGAQRGLLDLPTAFDALGRTSFHWTEALRKRMLMQ